MHILHVIPTGGVGGVETAAKKAAATNKNVTLIILAKDAKPGARGKILGTLLTMFRFSIFSRLRVTQSDVAVFSLWKTVPLLIYWKVRYRKPALFFLHSSKDKHLFDFVFTRIAVRVADGILADSRSTLEKRVAKSIARTKWVRVVSMLVGDVTKHPHGRRSPYRFIYWGRFNENKNVETALKLFAEIRRLLPDSHFLLIGPDDGTLRRCKDLVRTLDLASAVTFREPLSHAKIALFAGEASFFIQLSKYEGYAMSVAEAMRFGLIPVVTPVGEISNYCSDAHNAIYFTDLKTTACKVARIAEDFDLLNRIRNNVLVSMRGVKAYEEDFMDAVKEYKDKHA